MPTSSTRVVPKDVDPSTLPVWPTPPVKPKTPQEGARQLAVSANGDLAFIHRSGWRINKGPLHPFFKGPILADWSADGTFLGTLERGGPQYILRVYHGTNGTEVASWDVDLPEPTNTEGDYPDPTPYHLAHAPNEGGWALYATVGRFVVSASGVKPSKALKHQLYRDLAGNDFLDMQGTTYQTAKGKASMPCRPSHLTFHSDWNRLAILCRKNGGSKVHLLNVTEGEVIRSLDLGYGVGKIHLRDADTILALDGSALLTWTSEGVTREPNWLSAEPGCHPMVAAGAAIEPMAASKIHNGVAFVFGPAVGQRYSDTALKLATVRLSDCTVSTIDVPGSIQVNNVPIWIPSLQAFVAEISRGGRYGPGLVKAEDPSNWSYLFKENHDPRSYSLSPDGNRLVVADPKWTRFFEVKDDDLVETALLAPADRIQACNHTLSRFTYRHRKWVVHTPAGEGIAVYDSREKSIGCAGVEGGLAEGYD